MNWDAIGAIAELVGAAGVIATLGYLALQVRQNTISTRTSSYQAVVEAISEWTRALGMEPGVAQMFVTGLSNIDALSQEERTRFGFILIALFRNFENVFYQHQHGVVDDTIWEGWSFRIRSNFAAPGVQVWWKTARLAYSVPFRKFLEENPL